MNYSYCREQTFKEMNLFAANSVDLVRGLLIVSGCFLLYMLLSGMTDPVFSAFLFFLIATTCLFLFYFSARTQETRKLLLILTMAGTGFTFSEFIALWHYKSFVVNAPDLPRYSYDRTTYWVDDDELGYRPLPSKLVRARKEVNGLTIYDTEYTFDANALRNTRSNLSAQCTYLFFGGSAVFGEGLPDTHTLPYQFSEKLNFNYNVLNFAFHGYGPHQLLRILQSGVPIDLVEGKVSVIFYLLSTDDIYTITGLVQRYHKGPKYILASGRLEYVGGLNNIGGLMNSWIDFKAGILTLLRRSQLFSLVYGFPEIHSAKYLDGNVEFLVKILTEADRLVKDKYKAKFVVVSDIGESDTVHRILKILSSTDITIVEKSELFLQDRGEHYLIPGDIFPNELANDELATGLANQFGDC